MGASYVVWSITWTQYYLAAPIASVDAVLPGRTTSHDYLEDMLTAFHKQGLRVIFYYHSGHDNNPNLNWWNAFWTVSSTEFSATCHNVSEAGASAQFTSPAPRSLGTPWSDRTRARPTSISTVSSTRPSPCPYGRTRCGAASSPRKIDENGATLPVPLTPHHERRPTMTEAGHRLDAFPVQLAPEAVERFRKELLARVDRVAGEGPFEPSWSSLTQFQVPDWFRDAKFGIFIHWLASSVPAYGTEWYARTMYLAGTPEFTHHTSTYGPQKDFGFKDFLPHFTGSAFDADEWISLVARSGAQYVVPVAEHHDGFAFYDTQLSRWKAPLIGPGRDVIAELAAAARRANIRFGLSSHRAENWWFFNGGKRFDSDVNDPRWADLYGPAQPKSTQPDAEFLDDWLARTAEVVERYQPEVVYFDWWIEEPAFRDYLRRFAAYYYNQAAQQGDEVLVNYKWGAFDEGSAVHDIERGAVRNIQPRPFQNDTSMSRTAWCHLVDNTFKSLDELVADLVDTVSKNGSLLLNIGPRPDGTIVDEERALLEGIGDWLTVNGEAIFGTRPWLVYGEGPTHFDGGSFADTAKVPWTAQDTRFTCRDDQLYALVLRWPDDGNVVIRSLGTDLRLVDADIESVQLLGSTGTVAWRRDTDGLHVTLTEAAPSSVGACLRVRLRNRPIPPRYEPPMAE
jgi:alpha-L-fucosidase